MLLCECTKGAMLCCLIARSEARCSRLITLATKSTGNLVFDAPARMVVRSENFLRGGARDHAPCCVKGRKNYPTAIFKAFSKNARIGDRSGYRAFRSRVMSATVKRLW